LRVQLGFTILLTQVNAPYLSAQSYFGPAPLITLVIYGNITDLSTVNS
jgi:hypothetical protein